MRKRSPDPTPETGGCISLEALAARRDEAAIYQRCGTLDGSAKSVAVGKRNRRMVAQFTPEWTSLEPITEKTADASLENDLRAELSSNLNAIERRTWERIINGRPIREIAAEDGVRRSAIYERIRGNSKGQGGMIQKNPYVALWWSLRLRQQLEKKVKTQKI